MFIIHHWPTRSMFTKTENLYLYTNSLNLNFQAMLQNPKGFGFGAPTLAPSTSSSLLGLCVLYCKNWLQVAIRACEKFITKIIAYVLPLFNVGLLWCLSPSLYNPNLFWTLFLSLFFGACKSKVCPNIHHLPCKTHSLGDSSFFWCFFKLQNSKESSSF